MKRLIVIRHAKSSRDDPGLADFERPLNKRGKRDAPRMGRFLRGEGLVPDRVITSPALRAITTARAIVACLGEAPPSPVEEPAVYGADVEDLLGVVRALPGKAARVFLVGHNPGLQDLVNLLTRDALPHLATCGVVDLALDIDTWQDTDAGCGTLLGYTSPKMLKGNPNRA